MYQSTDYSQHSLFIQILNKKIIANKFGYVIYVPYLCYVGSKEKQAPSEIARRGVLLREPVPLFPVGQNKKMGHLVPSFLKYFHCVKRTPVITFSSEVVSNCVNSTAPVHRLMLDNQFERVLILNKFLNSSFNCCTSNDN